MRWLFALVFLAIAGGLHAQSVPNGTITQGEVWTPSQWNAAWQSKQDVATGLAADSVTSDDVALKAAVDACAAKGGRLILPPGKILLTGAATINLQSCTLQGSGFPAGSTTTASLGTTILLTSTSVKPFIVGKNWSVVGVNFYWPNQLDGLTVYPPLFSDDGLNEVSRAYIDKVVIVNAYDAFKQTTSAISWGDLTITNSEIYAVHDRLSISNTGGSFVLSNLLDGPGAWFSMCPACKASGGNNAAANNRWLHVTAGPAVTISTVNINTFAWRYGILIDAGGNLANSVMNFNFDGMGTLVDASSGGNYAVQNKLTGYNSNCGIISYATNPPTGTGNTPCFNMGGNSSLTLDNFTGGTAQGSYILASGGIVKVLNSNLGGIGLIADGSDYYMIHVTAGTALTELTVQNTVLAGRTSDVHVHGIVSDSTQIARLMVQNSSFGQFNEGISVPYPQTSIITSNYSVNTTGASSVLFSGSGFTNFSNNQFDKTPQVVIASGFGTGPTMFTGNEPTIFQLRVGTGGTASSGVVTLPFTPAHQYVCTASDPDGSASFIEAAVPTSLTNITITNYSRTTGLPVPWGSNDRVAVNCGAY
jgi:hypothetical protein